MSLDLEDLLLASTQALLGSVTPELRALSVGIRENYVLVWIYYDGFLNENQVDELDIISTEIFAFCPLDDTLMIETEIVRLDAPAPIPHHGELVYLRKETKSRSPMKIYPLQQKALFGSVKSLVSNLLQSFSTNSPHKTMFYEKDFLVSAASQALLGRIEANVRVVSITHGNKEVYLYYFHEGDLTPMNTTDIAGITSMLKSSITRQYNLHILTRRLDPPAPIPPMGWPVFKRKNENPGCSGFDLCYLEIATAKGLLGLATPNLREVIVTLGDTDIYLYCFFDGKVADASRKDMEEVAQRVKSRFPAEYSVHLNVERLDAPAVIPCIGESVYARAEQRPWTNSSE